MSSSKFAIKQTPLTNQNDNPKRYCPGTKFFCLVVKETEIAPGPPGLNMVVSETEVLSNY
jgi:hypothetical protein